MFLMVYWLSISIGLLQSLISILFLGIYQRTERYLNSSFMDLPQLFCLFSPIPTKCSLKLKFGFLTSLFEFKEILWRDCRSLGCKLITTYYSACIASSSSFDSFIYSFFYFSNMGKVWTSFSVHRLPLVARRRPGTNKPWFYNNIKVVEITC